MKNKFSGVTTALITPFKDGGLDISSLKSLIQYQIKNGVTNFVVNGTTAESPTLEEHEVEKIFQTVKQYTDKNAKIIIGTGTNSTKQSIENTKAAERLGADAALVVVPYYNKPQQRGLIEHFKEVASSVSIPIILYNVPGRTITSLELETVKKLSEHPNIIGIKEASGNIVFDRDIRKSCGEEFLLLSGDDGTYSDFLNIGGNGVISVASHIIPEQMIKNDLSRYKDLIDILFIEANPVPVKKSLQLMGIIDSAEVRLPLVELSEGHTEKLKNEMKKLGLL